MTEAIVVTSVSRQNNRAAKFGAIGLVLLLVVYVAPKLLGGGGGGEDAAADSIDFGQGGGAAAAAPTAPAAAAPETSRSFSTKNPFKPLFADATGASAVASSGEAVAQPTTPDIVDTTPVEVAPAPPADESPAPAPTAPVRFGLVQVGTDATGAPFASVRVDGGVFQAVTGQEFGGYFKVFSLDAASRCGVFLYGDQRFSLCEGEETTT